MPFGCPTTLANGNLRHAVQGLQPVGRGGTAVPKATFPTESPAKHPLPRRFLATRRGLFKQESGLGVSVGEMRPPAAQTHLQGLTGEGAAVLLQAGERKKEIMLGQDGGLSLTIAQIVQRLKASGLHSQLERQARVSWFVYLLGLLFPSVKEKLLLRLSLLSYVSILLPAMLPKSFPLISLSLVPSLFAALCLASLPSFPTLCTSPGLLFYIITINYYY